MNMRERERERETDRQRDRQTDRQSDRERAGDYAGRYVVNKVLCKLHNKTTHNLTIQELCYIISEKLGVLYVNKLTLQQSTDRFTL